MSDKRDAINLKWTRKLYQKNCGRRMRNVRDLLLAAVNRMESKGLSIRQNCMEFESEKVRERERQSTGRE